MRIAICSTPRSGNTWLRWLLREALQADELAVHVPTEIPATLPERLVLQLHWPPTEEYRAFLDAQRFRTVAAVRHPLDVLVSILHFVRHEPATTRWLDGLGLVDGLGGYGPTSDAFAAFATGPGAATLLNVTPAWLRVPGCARVRYEDLVADTEGTLSALARELDLHPVTSWQVAIAASPLEMFRSWPNRHGWRGTPGLWRQVIVAPIARRIAAAHADVFEALGCVCDPDPTLTVAEADARWLALVEKPLVEASR